MEISKLPMLNTVTRWNPPTPQRLVDRFIRESGSLSSFRFIAPRDFFSIRMLRFKGFP